MKSKSTYIINIIIIVLIFAILFSYMVRVDGWQNIVEILKTSSPLWVILGVVAILLSWIADAYIFHIITKKQYKKQKFLNSVKVTMIGQLFNNLTPLSTGGEPVQAYVMVKDGKTLSNSGTILLFKFVIFQLVLVLYTLIVLLFKFSYFKSFINNFAVLAIIGFSMNFLVIIALILIGTNKKITKFLFKPLFMIGVKLKIIKDIKKTYKKMIRAINDFNKKFKILRKEKALVIRTSLLTFVQLTLMFLTAYTIYRAFGYTGNVIVNIVSAQAILNLIMAIVPTPGAGIVAEGSFFVIFSIFFEKSKINMAILFWRLYTFYLPIIVGAFFMLFFNKKLKKKKTNKRYRVCKIDRDKIKNKISNFTKSIISQKKLYKY